jgi:hypothetical protein
LSVVNLVTAKQRLKRVVSREDEAGKVDEKFASNVEEDEEEVETDEPEEDVDLGDVGLFLEIIEDRILAKLQTPCISSMLVVDAVCDEMEGLWTVTCWMQQWESGCLG